MANLLFVQTSGGHDVLWFQERLGGSATNSDSSDFECNGDFATVGRAGQRSFLPARLLLTRRD